MWVRIHKIQKKKKKLHLFWHFFFQRFRHQTDLSLMCLDCLLTQLSKLQTAETGSSTHSRLHCLKSQNAPISPQITGCDPSRADRQTRLLWGTVHPSAVAHLRRDFRGRKSKENPKYKQNNNSAHCKTNKVIFWETHKENDLLMILTVT